MSIPSKILKIHDFLIANPLEQFTIIDVRSPAEFDEDHVPGAVNQPVLNNEERAFIGTMHKQVSSFKAREAGARIISKNISSILENISPLSENKKPFIIYCWRGGMRSKSLFTVMDMIGYKTYILEGGYKSYRRTVHQTLDSECTVVAQDKSMNIFSQIQEFLSIHGYTGSGKTELLQLLCSDYPVIDLEKAAVHRGSLLGSFKNTPQPSQKRFETNLFFQIFHQRNAGRMLVEGESRKIGNLSIPSVVWKKMKEGKKIWVELPLSFRIRNSIDVYQKDSLHILNKLFLLEEALGSKKTEWIREKLKNEQYEDAAEMLLSEYYDPLYTKHSPEYHPERYSKVIHAENLNDLYEKVRHYLKKISF